MKRSVHPRTVSVNQTQKMQSRLARKKALEWLAKTYPKAFDNTDSIRPLKVGIISDILKDAKESLEQDGISMSKLRQALAYFTQQMEYLTCLKAREMRVDLEGNSVSEVTFEEAESATLQIKQRIENNLKKAKKSLAESAKTTALSKGKKTSKEPAFTEKPRYNSAPPYIPSYREYDEMNPLSHQNELSEKRNTSVIVTHKNTRTFDPEAVQRLKEKLGLSRQTET